MGELHLEIVIDRLQKEFKVACRVGQPRVSYRETIQNEIEYEILFTKPIGGKEQFAQCKLMLTPTKGKGFQFENRLESDQIPEELIVAFEQGVKEASGSGVLAGFPVIDLKLSLIEAIYQKESSTEMAFKVAGLQGFRESVQLARPAILEPVMELEIVVPTQFTGEVIGDLNTRRGKVKGIEDRYGMQVVTGEVPLAEVFGYATDLRSATQGRAVYTIHFSHYETITEAKMKEIIGL